MGAKVVGMSHNDKKRQVAAELGCDEYLNTSDKEAFGAYERQMTHILCTGTSRDFDCKFTRKKNTGKFIN